MFCSELDKENKSVSIERIPALIIECCLHSIEPEYVALPLHFMATYDFKAIEQKWQENWAKSQLFKVLEEDSKPKYYVLDMFPYPSGAGLHVGHPLGYIASDIVSRYKRSKGYNVLHPMGFDAFGLPAEQYAIQTGQHPAITTQKNISRYKEQLNRIGFSYDWSREVQTCDPNYYRWTQWIFSQLFESWYNLKTNKAESIDQLISIFEIEGNVNIEHHGEAVDAFTAEDWQESTAKDRADKLQKYRLAFQKKTTVNWCEELGTVLANEEVKDGLSERGGYPVIQKEMTQWYLRITAYADRLLEGLDSVDWTDSLKEMQRNWIGKSQGAEIDFGLADNKTLKVYTTRPDTIFGATFMVVSAEHPLLAELITDDQKDEAEAYVQKASNKGERERMMNKEVSGVFTGSYATNPFNGDKLPIYIAEYVLMGYGTGAIMAVPAHDSRDHVFAKKYDLKIVQVIDNGTVQDVQEASFDSKEGRIINSGFIDGLSPVEAIKAVIQLAEEKGFGLGSTQYKLRDAGFSRQRYWGEPFPIIHNDGIAQLDKQLPITLPNVDSYKPTGTGESPLAAVEEWVQTEKGRRETDTMPGWAGSSWYFLRYMDPQNTEAFAHPNKLKYWNQVDLYIGGTEHATGHLLYSRFWTKFLYDRGYLTFDEPFKQLVNQGMIQGESMLLDFDNRSYHIPVNRANKDASIDRQAFESLMEEDNRFREMDIEALGWDGDKIQLRTQTEKMSKSKFNVVNPDDICDEYGADTLRLYEMFLGPLEDSKPWSTKGIDGTHRFLKKLWALFYSNEGELLLDNNEASKTSLKSLHKTIKKITEDIERHSFNTCISQFMICVNELGAENEHSQQILEPLVVLLAPFAPHISEELFSLFGYEHSVVDAPWPSHDESLLVEDSKLYPISVNGKTRTQIELSLSLSKEEIEQEVLKDEQVQKWMEGKKPRKVIVVPGRIVNIVV